jgi:tripartite-type tricarboxylate transporter receptor subunit TctC
MTRWMLACGLVCSAFGAHAAEAFPNRPISIIVPNPPGGMNDITARPLAIALQNHAKQPVVVQNKAGGASAVGTAFVAQQNPDGHNLLMTTANLYLIVERNKLFNEPPTYRLDQIAPVALMSADPLVMVVQTESPYMTVKDLVEAAKAKPGTFAFSSSGPYGITHVDIAMFNHAAGLTMRHVPTTGGGPALLQLLGGHVQVTSGAPASVFPHVKANKMRVLAHWGTKPIGVLPDVPSLKSLGYDVEAYLWVGLFTTAGVPEPTFTTLRDLVGKSARDPLFVDTLAKINNVVDYRDTPDFKKFFDEDHKRMAVAIQRIGKVETKDAKK